MDRTPKVQRKPSLSLSTRLNQKRHSESPQNRLKTSIANNVMKSPEINSNCEALQRSPSVISISSDGGIECTPPHKKMAMNLDESLDFSPKIFDSSFSPTCLLSQTLAIDSPEVGWKWSRYSVNGDCGNTKCNENTSIRTPDSAYAADSSFASAGSSTNEIAGNIPKEGDSHKRRNANEARREQRKILEQEYRRVEKTRAEENLKQRCAKLQEQLKSTETQRSKANDQKFEENSNKVDNNSLDSVEDRGQSTACTLTKTAENLHLSEKLKKPELYSEFFNDSDSDSFLLEATQEIESKIGAKTQPALKSFTSTSLKKQTSFECTSLPHVNAAPAANSTPPNSKSVAPIENVSFPNRDNKNKRSSFYMKFLEDDCPDDWFISLDEAILQTAPNRKPRTPLQRYKSMPSATDINSNATLNNNNCIISSNANSLTHLKVLSENTEASSSTLSKIKRHSSTHALNPTSTSYRSRRQL